MSIVKREGNFPLSMPCITTSRNVPCRRRRRRAAPIQVFVQRMQGSRVGFGVAWGSQIVVHVSGIGTVRIFFLSRVEELMYGWARLGLLYGMYVCMNGLLF